MADATKAQISTTRKCIDHAELLRVLHYDPLTGAFTWRVDRFAGEYHTRANVRAGEAAGSQTNNGNSDYIYIRIDRRLYPAHALAWFYMTGEYPEMVDHRDLDGLNNRFLNLRPCDKSTNAANTRAPKNNTSGFKGVTWDSTRKLWAAEVRHQNKRYRLGRFPTLEAAADAYAAKAKELFGEFARTA